MRDGLRDRLEAAFAEVIHLHCLDAYSTPPSHEVSAHSRLAAQFVATHVWPLIVADREQTRQDAYQQGRQDEAAAAEAERRRHSHPDAPFARGYWNP